MYSTFGGEENIIETTNVIGEKVINVGEKIGKEVVHKVINTEVGKTVVDTGDKIGKAVFDKVIDTPIFYNVIRQIFKYLIQGFVVAIAGYYIPAKKPEWNEILMISLVAASTFAILEIYMPDAYLAARFGFGFTTGSNLIPKFLI
jgi:hypothetical protein